MPMSLIVEIIVAIISGGLVGTIVNVVTSRRARKVEGIKSYQETINMLMRTNSELIDERTKLMQEISDLNSKVDTDDV